ncbi:MAG TPA: hypothetical protein VGQ10_20950 [Vicinamibacterales bacterium]|nr:hypothetical protein [Vicinamibacterales bacterium]
MTKIVARVCAFFVVIVAATNSYGGQRSLDLASPSGTKTSLTAQPGEVVTFTLINKVPVSKPYTITVEERVIPIPQFGTPLALLGGFPDDACDPIVKDAETLAKATDETQVGETVRRIRVALAAAVCTTPAKLAKINEWLVLTIHVVPGQYVVRAGAEILLTVSRDDKVWTLAISGGPRGAWVTTVGVSIVPSRDEPHFTKALDGGKFAVTREADVDDLRLIPSLFFSWLPRKRMLGDFSFGPTAGLGLTKDKAAVFGGVGLTYNRNLAFITGVAFSPHTRLRGRYTAGEELTESLSDEQINREVYRPTWLFAMTFRFGSKPSGSGGDQPVSEGPSAEQKKKLAEKAAAAIAGAQTLSEGGFVEGVGVLFPQEAPNDSKRAVVALRARGELFYKPAPWIQFAAGLDLRASSHQQVEKGWRVDYSDRGVREPQLSVRRLSATLTGGKFTLDVGKQFSRWGKTDIVTPTDRFAPRDFLNVIDTEVFAITAIRGVAQAGDGTFEVVWAPRFTPSRIPLLQQRWTVVPPGAAAIPILDAGANLPSGSQTGVRWSHVGQGIDYSLSYFDGFNHLPAIRSEPSLTPPQIAITRLYPAIRSYGADLAAPTPWFTVKAEGAYVTSLNHVADDYVLYVLQLERQSGEWVFVGGYAGEVVVRARTSLVFAPDRGLSRAVVARASYTLDPNRSVAFEGAARENGRGVYARAEYAQARGQHWRATIAAVAIGGHADDFLGQYRRNSHATMTLRYSF